MENNGNVVFNEISIVRLGNREEGGDPPPHLFLQLTSGQIFKDHADCFSFTSDIWFMICGHVSRDGSHRDNFDGNL